LAKALAPLPLEKHPQLLVGTETADDAGVYKIAEDTALVQTIDLITPIVDDAFLFGQIAAANSLSDIYAMGGRPLTAMNIICFPRLSLDISVLTEILQGGLEKVHEAGAVLMGGHTVEDAELKYGLAVTGTVHPQKIITNKGAQLGDVLILTKPLGTGIISTAQKAGLAETEALEAAARQMVALNNQAAQAMGECQAHACTDITGFGLLGHAVEMARGCGFSLRLFYEQIPFLPKVKNYAASGLVPGGAYCNEGHFGSEIFWGEKIPSLEKIILFDPQTSGGLLIALPKEQSQKLLELLLKKGVRDATLIGEVIPREKYSIIVA